MKTVLIIIFSLLFVGASCNISSPFAGSSYQDAVVDIGGKQVNVQLSDTQEELTAGLSGRGGLNETEGMLFLMSGPARHGFWMKGMKFPIDIIWINGNQVVDIHQHVETEPGKDDKDLTMYRPSTEADKVLELKSGWAIRHNVKVGDQIKITRITK